MHLDPDDVLAIKYCVASEIHRHRYRNVPPPQWMTDIHDRLETAMREPQGDQPGPIPASCEWLSTAEFAARLGISDRAARRRAAKIGRKVGWQWVIAADALPEVEDWRGS
jgi:hypothetical protein